MPTSLDAIALILLAAGGGRRLGGGKLTLPWRGKPLLAHVLGAAAAMRRPRPLVVVAGHGAPGIREIVRGFPADSRARWRVADNADWRSGMGSSLRVGVEETLRMDGAGTRRGVMVLLGDQPLVRPDTLDRLADAHLEACLSRPGHAATVPYFEGRRGNPAVLSPLLFPEILRLRGDEGARGILRSLGDALLPLPVDDPGVLRDVDTPEDFASLPG